MTNSKHDGLAGFLSFVVPGLGQVYNGHKIKGILFFLVPFTLWNIAYIFFPTEMQFGRGLFREYLFATIMAFIIRIWSAREASGSAKAINFGTDTGDISISKLKSYGITGILFKKKGILVIIFLIFLVWGFTSTSHTDYGEYGYTAKGSIIATNSAYKLVDYEEATDSHFVAEREDSNYYYGHWRGGHDARFNYEESYQINLSDINWTSAELFDPNNKNMSEEIALADVRENITDIILKANESGTISVDIYRPGENDNLYNYGTLDESYTLKGDILSYNYTWTSEEVENRSGDLTYTFKISILKNESDKLPYKVVIFNVTIPEKNIDIKDPGIRMEGGKNYEVEKNY